VSRDSITAGDGTSAATCDVTAAVVSDDVSSHPLLADQPEVVRQLVGTMIAKWNARASDVISAATDDDGAVRLDVMEVEGDLASNVMPQVSTLQHPRIM